MCFSGDMCQHMVDVNAAEINGCGCCGLYCYLLHHFLRLRIEKNTTTAKKAMMPIAHGIHKGAKTHPQFISGQVVSFRATKSTVSHKRMIVAMSFFFILFHRLRVVLRSL